MRLPRPIAITLALAGVALAGGLVALAATYHHWRVNKLTLLEPRLLTGVASWSSPAPDGCRLLMIGDSRIADWPLVPPEGWQVGRLGFPGATSGNILAAAVPVLARERPDAVLIQSGTNDATVAVLVPEEAQRILDDAAGNVAATVRTARAAGARTVIIMTIAPPIQPGLRARLVMGDRQTQFMRALTPRLARLAADGGAQLIHTEAALSDANGNLDPAFRADDLHWRPAAYKRLDRLRDTLLADACSSNQRFSSNGSGSLPAR